MTLTLQYSFALMDAITYRRWILLVTKEYAETMHKNKNRRIPIRQQSVTATKDHSNLSRFDADRPKTSTLYNPDQHRNEADRNDEEFYIWRRRIVEEIWNIIRDLMKSLPSVALGCIASGTSLTYVTGNTWWPWIMLSPLILYITILLIASISLIVTFLVIQKK